MSQEFGGARPTVILEEIDRLPAGFMEQLLEYRHFAEAVQALDAADTTERRQALGAHPMVALAEEIEFGMAEAEMKEANG